MYDAIVYYSVTNCYCCSSSQLSLVSSSQICLSTAFLCKFYIFSLSFCASCEWIAKCCALLESAPNHFIARNYGLAIANDDHRNMLLLFFVGFWCISIMRLSACVPVHHFIKANLRNENYFGMFFLFLSVDVRERVLNPSMSFVLLKIQLIWHLIWFEMYKNCFGIFEVLLLLIISSFCYLSRTVNTHNNHNGWYFPVN